MPSFTTAVAQAVEEAMKAAGASQTNVSEGTGIPQPTLSRRLRGLTPFDVKELKDIADYLGVSPSLFIPEAVA